MGFCDDDTEEVNGWDIGCSDSSNRSEKSIHSRRGKETKRENASLMKRYGHVYDRNSY